MIIVYIIAGIIGVLAALGFFEMLGRICDRVDRARDRTRQQRRVMANIRMYDASNELIHRASKVSFLRKQAG